MKKKREKEIRDLVKKEMTQNFGTVFKNDMVKK